MQYLQLLPNAEFSYFGENGCVFHLLNQKRFPCDKKIAALLEELLKGKPYVESECEEGFKQYLSQLMQEGMLYLYPAPVYHEAFCSKSKMEIRGLFEEPPQMNQIYIQGAVKCNYNCKYCKINQEQTIINYGCRSCIQWGDVHTSDTISDRIEDIKRLLRLRHSKITISGGNPFLDWQETKRVLNAILQTDSSTEIHIIHNGSMLSDEILCYLKEYNIHIEVMVFGYDKNSYLKVTESENAYQDLKALLKQFQALHIVYELIPIGSSSELEMIEEYIMNRYNVPTQHMVEINETEEKLRTSMSYPERKKLPLDGFFDEKRYNRCLYGKLALTMEGRIQPCPMLNEELVHLKVQGLEYIFQGQLIDKYWRMTRSSFHACGQCPYQWLCTDCTKTMEIINRNGEHSGWVCEHMKDSEGGNTYGAATSTIRHS